MAQSCCFDRDTYPPRPHVHSVPGIPGVERTFVTRALPSAGFSITIRVALPADPSAIGRLTTAVGGPGGLVTALDVVDSDPVTVLAGVTCHTPHTGHANHAVAALRAPPG